ncbi:MAG: putative oxidoreductase [Thermoanaerobaculia bacterium]|nr:putative oxidoreductase [Thermoanaerobaculia bacterium]
MTKKAIAKEVAVWLLTLLLVAMFANAGIRKFPESGGWTRMFRLAGFPDWFRILIGVIEVAAAALLLIPRTAAYGAITVIVVMIGALGTVAMTLHGTFMMRGLMPASVALIIGVIVLMARWRQRLVIPRSLDLAGAG